MKQKAYMAAERGFTLIELMVAIGIFGVVSAIMATGFARLLTAVHDNEIRSGAYNAAQNVLDQLRSTDPALMPPTGSMPVESVAVGARTFSTVTSYCTIPALCTSNTVRQVQVTVNYHGKQRYQVSTIFSQLD